MMLLLLVVWYDDFLPMSTLFQDWLTNQNLHEKAQLKQRLVMELNQIILYQ